MESLVILAQAEVNEAPESVGSTPVGETAEYESGTKQQASPDANLPGEKPAPRGLFDSPLILLVLMFVLFYFLFFRGPRKKRQQHRQMLK